MENKFNANEWFVEGEEELKKENANNTKGIDNNFAFNDPLEPFRHLINAKTEITPKMAKSFAKKLNPELCTMKNLWGIMSLITLILGIPFMAAGIPIVLLIFIGFIIGFAKTSSKVSVLKKTITSFKTVDKFDLYYNKMKSANLTNLPFRYDDKAIYNKDNAIFSIDNICLIYTAGKKVHFGTIKGDLIKFDISLSNENQTALINIFKTANPNIMIGIEYIEAVNKLFGT